MLIYVGQSVISERAAELDIMEEIENKEVFLYVNKGLQCFSTTVWYLITSVPVFRKHFLKTRKTSQFSKVTCNMMANENMTDNWNNRLLRMLEWELGDGKQHDSSEFLILLLERMIDVSGYFLSLSSINNSIHRIK